MERIVGRRELPAEISMTKEASPPDTQARGRPPQFRQLDSPIASIELHGHGDCQLPLLASHQPAQRRMQSSLLAPRFMKSIPATGNSGRPIFLGTICYFFRSGISALSRRDDVTVNRQQLALLRSMEVLGCASCNGRGDAHECLQVITSLAEGQQYPAKCLNEASEMDKIRLDEPGYTPELHDRADCAARYESVEAKCYASSASDIASQLGP